MAKANDQNAPKEASRRTRGFEPAARLVAQQLRAPFEKRGFAQLRLVTHWAEIVGPDLAEMCQPVQISKGQGMGGRLVLLTTGPHAPVLEMRKEDIRARVNAAYGYAAIAQIRLTQTASGALAEFGAPKPHPKSPPPPSPATQARAHQAAGGITDETLKAALERLACKVLQKSQA